MYLKYYGKHMMRHVPGTTKCGSLKRLVAQKRPHSMIFNLGYKQHCITTARFFASTDSGGIVKQSSHKVRMDPYDRHQLHSLLSRTNTVCVQIQTSYLEESSDNKSSAVL